MKEKAREEELQIAETKMVMHQVSKRESHCINVVVATEFCLMSILIMVDSSPCNFVSYRRLLSGNAAKQRSKIISCGRNLVVEVLDTRLA